MSSRAFVRIPIVAPLLATAVLAGCSGSGSSGPGSTSARANHTLRSSAQIATFVEEVARGKRSRWTLAPSATPAARRAWTNGATIKTIGIELRFGQAEWGCMELSMLHHGASTHEAVLIAKRRGGATLIANQLAVEYVRFSSAELADIIDADCAGEPL